MANTPLPYGRQSLDEADIEAVCDVLRGDWLTCGPAVDQFENALAAEVGANDAVACSSGTAALHLAALASGLETGDTVVVPSLTFVATANAARYVGAEVIFADVDPETGLMGESELSDALERHTGQNRTRAVFPVHLNGQPADSKAIRRLAGERELFVVEDASHSLGACLTPPENDESAVGGCRYSDLTVFSFHPVKTVAMGEGGAITTNDVSLAKRLRRFRAHGIERDPSMFEHIDQAVDELGAPNPWYYEMSELGFNYRASDIHCALGLSQLGKLGTFVARRRELVALYDRLLSPLSPVVRPVERTPACEPAWHLYVALIDFEETGQSRARVMQALRARGVFTQVHYLPVHRQPYYLARYGNLSLPGADAYYARCLSLPLFPSMLDEDVHRVVETLKDLLES